MGWWKRCCGPSREDDLRKSQDLFAPRSGFPNPDGVAIKLDRIDAVKFRQVAGQFLKTFLHLPFHARRVSLLMMVKGDREMNQRLEKEPALPPLVPPHFFEHFVTFEVLAMVEQLDPAVEFAGRGRFHFRARDLNQSSVRRKPCSNENAGT